MNRYHRSTSARRNAIALWVCMVRRAFLLALVGVAGCGVKKGSGEKFALMSPPPGQSLIYHYRLSKYGSYGVFYNAYANEEPFVIVGSGGYYPQLVAPGEVTYKALPQMQFVGVGLLDVAILNALAKEQPVFELETKAGEVRFVKWDATIDFWSSVRRPNVREVTSEVAMKEMKNLKQFSELTADQIGKMVEKRKPGCH